MNPIYAITSDDARVKAAVAWLQSKGAPAKVEYFDGADEGPYPIQMHVVTFVAGAKRMTVTAGLMALYPSITFTELLGAGLISAQ